MSFVRTEPKAGRFLTTVSLMVISLTSTSRSFVKKKAALTLLRLYRKHPDVIPAAEWALRIVSILDDQNLASRRCLLYGGEASWLLTVMTLFSGRRTGGRESRSDARAGQPRSVCRMLPEGSQSIEQGQTPSFSIKH